ncbi:MAG TPA: hypothetical protein VJ998_10800 [Pseudomonadales bacterium]|nr:hypothetical protein [Pseudomonadales bacterium]
MKNFILMVGIITLAACASHPTPYEKAVSVGKYGYHESQVAPNRYRVSFSGNTTSTPDRVKDFALRRAAELTLLNNHDWFRITGQDSDHVTHSTPSVETTMTTPPQEHRTCGLLGCSTVVTPAYNAMTVSSGRESHTYTSSIDIVMGDGKVDDSSAYNAKQLLDFLEAKYSKHT